jgi:hypothetical protein
MSDVLHNVIFEPASAAAAPSGTGGDIGFETYSYAQPADSFASMTSQGGSGSVGGGGGGFSGSGSVDPLNEPPLLEGEFHRLISVSAC